MTLTLTRPRSVLTLTGMKPRRMSATHVETSQDIHLPVELWLEIFQYLTTPSTKTVTLTCKAFRWLAQPLLFKVFVVRIHLSTQFPHNIRWDAHPTNLRERLSLLELPHIANAIEELSIIPTTSAAADTPQSREPSALPRVMEDIIDDLFGFFPSLVNLKRLVCNNVSFTSSRLLALRHLPQLRDLELQSCYTKCNIDALPDFSSVPLETLVFDHPYDSLDFYRNTRFLALFLQSRKLKRIFAGPANDILFALTSARPPALLTTLEIPISCVASPAFTSALACCPAVQDLSLRMVPGNNRIPQLDSIPPEVLPGLRSYRGPRIYAHLFTRDRDVRNVEFSLSCPPDDLAETLRRLDADLESLSCKVHHLDAPLLRTIHTTFPSLKHLAVSSAAVDIHTLSSMLDVAKVHRNLRAVQLTIQMGLPRLTASWRTISSQMFLKRLIYSYPALQTAKLGYQPGLAVAWERPAGCKSNIDVERLVGPAQLRVEKQLDAPQHLWGVWGALNAKH